MKKRKAFVTLELLLVIAIGVAGIGTIFAINDKLNDNMTYIKFSQDLKSIILSMDTQKRKFKAYPNEENAIIIKNSLIYNKEEYIVSHLAANNWDYKTIRLLEEDDVKYSTGLVLLKLHNNRYPEISDKQVKDTFFKVCLNSISDVIVSNSITIEKLNGKYDWCLIKNNVKLFTTN